MTNEQLVLRIRAGEDVGQNMAQLYGQMRQDIHGIALRYRGYAEVEDLDQEGYLALYDAVDGYDPAAGYRFLTYARYWIRQRMIRYIQDNGTIRLPAGEQGRIRELEKLEEKYMSYLGRKPSEGEAAGILGLSPGRVRQLKKSSMLGRVGSLDVPAGEEGDTALWELVAGGEDVEGNVLDDVELGELRGVLWPMVDSLGKERAHVIRGRYAGRKNYRELAEDLGMSAARANRIEKEALRELRRKRDKLAPFLPEALGSKAYQGGASSFKRTWTSSTERAALLLE